MCVHVHASLGISHISHLVGHRRSQLLNRIHDVGRALRAAPGARGLKMFSACGVCELKIFVACGAPSTDRKGRKAQIFPKMNRKNPKKIFASGEGKLSENLSINIYWLAKTVR